MRGLQNYNSIPEFTDSFKLPCGGGKSVILAEIAKIYTLMEK